MSNDLISREALKEVLKECAYSYDGVNTWIMKDEVLGIIDNAPTIELDESVIQEVLNKRFMTAVANEYLIALHVKGGTPQGEWLVVGHDDTTYWYRCSICKYEEHDNFTKHHHYCPNCGANMRGGAK